MYLRVACGVLALMLSACSSDSKKREVDADAGAGGSMSGAGGRGAGGRQGSGGAGSGGAPASGGALASGGVPAGGGGPGSGGAIPDASVEAGPDAVADASGPSCDASVPDAGASLFCPDVLAGAPRFDAATNRLIVRLPGLPRIVSGAFQASLAFVGGGVSAYYDAGIVQVSGADLVLDISPMFDSGRPEIVEICALEVTDECGRRHSLDRFYYDDAGNRAELLRMVASDGGDFTPVCRLDYDLCND